MLSSICYVQIKIKLIPSKSEFLNTINRACSGSVVRGEQVRASPVQWKEQDSAGADLAEQAQLVKLLLLGQSESSRASYRRLNPLYQQPTEVEMIVKRV